MQLPATAPAFARSFARARLPRRSAARAGFDRAHAPSFGPASQSYNTPSASLRDRVSKTPFAWGSTKAACQSFMGPWLKSEAPALQAVLSGSVTRRTPPFSNEAISLSLFYITGSDVEFHYEKRLSIEAAGSTDLQVETAVVERKFAFSNSR